MDGRIEGLTAYISPTVTIAGERPRVAPSVGRNKVATTRDPRTEIIKKCIELIKDRGFLEKAKYACKKLNLRARGIKTLRNDMTQFVLHFFKRNTCMDRQICGQGIF